MFGSGTATNVVPICQMGYMDKVYDLKMNEAK